MENIDKNIIKGLKSGEEKAFRFIYDMYYQQLCNIAKAFVKDDFLSEAIVEDVIFHLWEKRELIEIKSSLKGYLIRSVRNSCINYLQKRTTRMESSFSEIESNSDLHSHPSEEYPSMILIEKELEQKIFKSIQNLPKECSTVFKMSRFQNLKHEEIAIQQGISINTVKYHIKNALAHLRNDLKEFL